MELCRFIEDQAWLQLPAWAEKLVKHGIDVEGFEALPLDGKAFPYQG